MLSPSLLLRQAVIAMVNTYIRSKDVYIGLCVTQLLSIISTADELWRNGIGLGNATASLLACFRRETM